MKSNIKYRIVLISLVLLTIFLIQFNYSKVEAGLPITPGYIYIKVTNIDDEDEVKVLYEKDFDIFNQCEVTEFSFEDDWYYDYSITEIVYNEIENYGIYMISDDYGYSTSREFKILIDKEEEYIESDVISAVYGDEDNEIDAEFNCEDGIHLAKFSITRILGRIANYENDWIKAIICLAISILLIVILLNKMNVKGKTGFITFTILLQAIVYLCFVVLRGFSFIEEIWLNLGAWWQALLYLIITLILPMVFLNMLQYNFINSNNSEMNEKAIKKVRMLSNAIEIMMLVLCIIWTY